MYNETMERANDMENYDDVEAVMLLNTCTIKVLMAVYYNMVLRECEGGVCAGCRVEMLMRVTPWGCFNLAEILIALCVVGKLAQHP